VAKPRPPATPTPAPEVGKSLADLVEALNKLPAWHGVLGWNEFTNRIVFRKEPPFKGASRLGDVLRDEDIIRMRLWFEQHHGVEVSRQNLLDAARLVAGEHRFHPVQEYLKSLSWDGIPRVDTWLEDFCSVKPSSPDHQRLVRSVARKWLLSCVARAMNPGCKVDTMLILEGKQGLGKSTALRALAGEDFFCDSLLDFGGKDACQNIQGVWIYELPELDALLRAESGSTKAFLTRTFDKFRAPYARAPMIAPRSVVFCGTVNHGGYLKDQSGNRRFWVVQCGETLNVHGIRESRDQLWAEARVLFEQGEPWHLSAEDEAVMHEQHADRMEDEPWEEAIASWTERQGDTPIAIDALLENALGMKAASRNPNVTQRVHHILERLGFERQRKAFEGAGRRVYRYVRRQESACPTDSLPYCPRVDLQVEDRPPVTEP
jgi:putative DNA primase/helicase